MPSHDLGKPTGRVYYRARDNQASGWVNAGTDFARAFALWPRKPELWAEYERGAWRLA